MCSSLENIRVENFDSKRARRGDFAVWGFFTCPTWWGGHLHCWPGAREAEGEGDSFACSFIVFKTEGLPSSGRGFLFSSQRVLWDGEQEVNGLTSCSWQQQQEKKKVRLGIMEADLILLCSLAVHLFFFFSSSSLKAWRTQFWNEAVFLGESPPGGVYTLGGHFTDLLNFQ